MPDDWPCYYDLVGAVDYRPPNQDCARSHKQVKVYLERAIAARAGADVIYFLESVEGASSWASRRGPLDGFSSTRVERLAPQAAGANKTVRLESARACELKLAIRSVEGLGASKAPFRTS